MRPAKEKKKIAIESKTQREKREGEGGKRGYEK
jgi:hypothetical protein